VNDKTAEKKYSDALRFTRVNELHRNALLSDDWELNELSMHECKKKMQQKLLTVTRFLYFTQGSTVEQRD